MFQTQSLLWRVHGDQGMTVEGIPDGGFSAQVKPSQEWIAQILFALMAKAEGGSRAFEKWHDNDGQ